MTVIDAPIDGVGIIAQVAETAAASTRLKVLMYMIDLEAKMAFAMGRKSKARAVDSTKLSLVVFSLFGTARRYLATDNRWSAVYARSR